MSAAAVHLISTYISEALKWLGRYRTTLFVAQREGSVEIIRIRGNITLYDYRHFMFVFYISLVLI